MPYKVNPTTGQLDYYEVSEGGGGGAAANLAFVPSPTTGTITSDSGTDADIPLANSTNSGLFSPQEKARLEIALVNDTVFRGLYSPSAFYAIGDVVDYFGVLYQRTSSGNQPGIQPPSPEWFLYEAEIGSDVFDHWIRVELSKRLISQDINYQGDYNNGISYPLNAVVRIPEGSPYGLPGQLFIRVTNPLNPGYPPGTPSWELLNIYTGSPAFDYWIRSVLQTKVTVEIGKGLSTEDYTTAEQTKLAGIEAGAEVNVNADWNATSGDALILNKPTELPTSFVRHDVKYGIALTKGQAAYVTSSDGTNMIVSKADYSMESTSSKTMGLIGETGALNHQGFIVTEGLLAGLDTTGTQLGDPVWLGDDGNLLYGLANKPVAPNHMVFLGIVTRVNANNGEIFVKVQNGYELNEIHDLSVPTYIDKGVIYRDVATNLWKHETIANLVGNASALQLGLLSSTDWSTFNSKEPAITTGLSTQYFRGDKTWQTLNNIAVGLGNVPNVDATNPANIVQTSSYRFVTDAEKSTWNSSSSLIPDLKGNEVFRGVTFRPNSTTIDTLGGITNNLSGTQGANTVAVTNFRTRQATMRFEPSTVGTGNYCCMRTSAALWSITGGFLFVGEFGIADSNYAVGAHNFWGLTSSVTNLAIGTISNLQPSALTNIIALANDSGDANLQIMHNDASGTATKIDLGSDFPSNRTSGAVSTTMYYVRFYNPAGTSEIRYSVINRETGAEASGTITTNLPDPSVLLAYQAGRSMGTGGGGVSSSGRFDVKILGVYNY